MNEEDMKSLGIPMVLQGLCLFLSPSWLACLSSA
jgi:hypothetical protein